MLIRLKEKHSEEIASLQATLQKQHEEAEDRLAAMTDKVDKLRKINKELESNKEESSVEKTRERVERAVRQAVNEQRVEQARREEEIEMNWTKRMADLEQVWARKVDDLEEVHKVCVSLRWFMYDMCQ